MTHTTPTRSPSWGTLTREGIITTAIELLDQQSTPFTMRHLGARLDVQAMSLYRHIHNKDDVLTGVHAALAAHLDISSTRADRTWQEHITALAHAAQQIATDHPRGFALLCTIPAPAGTLPPIADLPTTTHLLHTLHADGFTPAQAHAAYRALCRFLIGHLLPHAHHTPDPNHTHPCPPGPTRLLQDNPPTAFSHHLHELLAEVDRLQRPTPTQTTQRHTTACTNWVAAGN